MGVRTAGPADSKDVQALTCELGYQVEESVVSDRLAAMRDSPDHEVFVFESDGSIAGWIHVGLIQQLMESPVAEIGGLVVGARFRRRGIATALVGAAKEWAYGMAVTTLRVRTNQLRDDAKDFYRTSGFEAVKTQAVFDLLLMPGS